MQVVDVRTADAGIANDRVGVTSETWSNIWEEWKTYCRSLKVPPYLGDCNFQTVARVSIMFGGHIRRGKRGKVVSAGMVRAGLGGANTTIAMETGKQPLHQLDGKHYIKPLQHMMAGFGNYDHMTEKKLAYHPDLAAFAVKWAYRAKKKPDQSQHAMGDLVLIAFYYLLCVGEYTTKTRWKKKTRMQQF